MVFLSRLEWTFELEPVILYDGETYIILSMKNLAGGEERESERGKVKKKER